MIAPLPSDPLVDLGVSYVLETGVNLTAEHVVSLRSTLTSYVQGLISYRDAVALLSPFVPSTQALDRIERILRTPPVPLAPCEASAERTDERLRAKARTWSPYEDQRLLAGIHRFGAGDWQAIADFVGNSRTRSQSYQRWTRGLDPNINKTKWTPEQDSRLLMFVQVFGGRSWSKVSAELGNRCDVQCRYRYNQLIKDPRFPMMETEAIQAARELMRTTDLRSAPKGRRAAVARLPAIQAMADFMAFPPTSTPIVMLSQVEQRRH